MHISCFLGACRDERNNLLTAINLRNVAACANVTDSAAEELRHIMRDIAIFTDIKRQISTK